MLTFLKGAEPIKTREGRFQKTPRCVNMPRCPSSVLEGHGGKGGSQKGGVTDRVQKLLDSCKGYTKHACHLPSRGQPEEGLASLSELLSAKLGPLSWPRMWLFRLYWELKVFSQPSLGQRNGFSPGAHTGSHMISQMIL